MRTFSSSLNSDIFCAHFAAKLKVDHDDGDLRTGDDQDDEDEEEKSEQVVELILPNGREDEKQLDEHGAERKDSGHQRAAEERNFTVSKNSFNTNALRT